MNDSFQIVHTISDYYDGPRSGVANFEGVPHYYRSIYLDAEEWNPDEDRFELSPVGEEVLAAALEEEAIFERWNSQRKKTPEFHYTDEVFGALPEDSLRRAQLKTFLDSSYAAAAKVHRFLVHGTFQINKSLSSRLEVHWRLAERGVQAKPKAAP